MPQIFQWTCLAVELTLLNLPCLMLTLWSNQGYVWIALSNLNSHRCLLIRSRFRFQDGGRPEEPDFQLISSCPCVVVPPPNSTLLCTEQNPPCRSSEITDDYKHPLLSNIHEQVVKSPTGQHWIAGCLLTTGKWERSWIGRCLIIPLYHSSEHL